MPEELLEREGELAAIAAAVTAAARHEGSLVLVRGPAGIGKTALLRAGRGVAATAGLTPLQATGALLDRPFPFGLVHQLLDPVMLGADAERRDRLLRGAAALAGPVLLGGQAVGADPEHAVLHGLYWTLANLAEEGPLALVVDDLHWGDRASLRCLEFLGRRLEGIGLVVIAGTRTGEPDAEEALLGALAAGRAATVLTPSPLGEASVGTVVAGGIGAAPGSAFAAACADATGGNPLLVAELARAAAESGLTGANAEAADVAGLGGAGVAGHVRRRLDTLGEAARAVAVATAVLGDRARPADVAALAALDPGAAAEAGDRLVLAGVLVEGAVPAGRPVGPGALAGAAAADGRPVAPGALAGGGRRFAHPLVRDAVLADLSPRATAQLHARAAERLHADGARADVVASHLLAVEPAGADWVVAVLRAAARMAAEGAADTGVALLRRALAEPPPVADRAAVLHELGTLEASAGDPAAHEHLQAALDLGLDGEVRSQARATLGQALLQHDPGAAFASLEAAMAETADPVLRMRAETTMLDATIYDLGLYDRRSALLGSEEEPSVARLAHLAVEAGYAPGPQHVVDGYVRRALAAEGQLAQLGAGSTTVQLMAMAARNVELAELSEAVNAHIEAARLREGSVYGLLLVEHARSLWHWFFGSLASAEAHVRAAIEIVEAAGYGYARLAMTTVLSEILRERGDLPGALALADGPQLSQALTASVVGADFLSARGVARWESGRRDEAEVDLRQARDLLAVRGWRNPLKGRAGLRLAELLAEGGRREEATEIASEIVAVAEGSGLHGARGMALRVLARATEDGAAAEQQLLAAVAALERSPMGLERGWALHDLGRLQRHAGRRSDARETLRRALDIAERLGAGALGTATREELQQAGARLRRAAISGPDALTPAERRVAEHAARGLSNREIAETLWLSRKTVEVHLGHAYGKLGIRSRTELPAAMG